MRGEKMKQYYTLESEAKEIFIKIPKILFLKDSKYFKMSADAKLLYGLLKDRNQLSIKNNWVDKEGRIYFLFNQFDLSELVGKDIKTVRKYLKELEKYELIERVRQGMNLPDKLYLLQLEVTESQSYELIGKIYASGQGNFTHPDRENLSPNKKEINKKEINNSIYNVIIEKWNCITELSNVLKISDKRKKAILSLLEEYTEEDILKAIDNVATSDFLKGINTDWKCSFDWILNKNNFLKILEGTYNKANAKATKKKEVKIEVDNDMIAALQNDF